MKGEPSGRSHRKGAPVSPVSRAPSLPSSKISDCTRHAMNTAIYSPTQRNLVLRWLDETFDSKELADYGGLQIEHILTQSGTPNWRRVIAEDCDPSERPEDVYEGFLHIVGNLTLTGYNPKLGNSPFDVKRKQLAQSALLMNREIAEQERWGRPEILARAHRLADRAVKLRPGPRPRSRWGRRGCPARWRQSPPRPLVRVQRSDHPPPARDCLDSCSLRRSLGHVAPNRLGTDGSEPKNLTNSAERVANREHSCSRPGGKPSK
jgi:Protein of unknown function (DUF1524)